MKRILTASGHIAYEASAAETELIGGMGICDTCNHWAANGYLIPALNRYKCKDCFEDWTERAKFYQEDAAIELQIATYYEKKIGVTSNGRESTTGA